MTELWTLCEHQELDPHLKRPRKIVECPGGRPATVEEVVEWLVERGEWPHGIAPTPIGKAQDV